MYSTSYSCPILMKLVFYRYVFEKSSNVKFHGNTSSGSRAVPCGRTDRHDEANSRFSQFCERALKKTHADVFTCSKYYSLDKVKGMNPQSKHKSFRLYKLCFDSLFIPLSSIGLRHNGMCSINLQSRLQPKQST